MRWSALAAVVLLFTATQAKAELLIRIDKNSQQMTVTRDGQVIHRWPVSTGIAKYDTPDGDFRPFRMEKDHFSKEWDDAPMPYSIFFTKQGHAIHGTNHTSIGRPASHGCVRLSVAHAAQLWDLVTAEGMNKTKVVLTGELPTSDLIAKRSRIPDGDLTTGSAPREGAVQGYPRYYNSDEYAQRPPRYVYREQPYYYRQPSYTYQQPVYRERYAPAPYPFFFNGR
jgi:hypothetical protein